MNTIKRILSLFHPEQYQGWGREKKYFEGWYFKVVNRERTKAYAFIPGIAMDLLGEKHAFIQVLDGIAKKSDYHSFDASLFVPTDGKFDLTIGTNRFSSQSLVLDLPSIRGTLSFTNLVTWPDKWYSPGIMGPYTFAPFMECNHGIVSMDHNIEGMLQINGEVVDFSGGRGYTEKDWGHSFPSAYIWIQSNHFENAGTSFKASVARIPWMTGSFAGFIAGLWHGGRLYSFTTYNRSALKKLILTGSLAELVFESRLYTLRVKAVTDNATPLSAPVRGLMEGRIEESMTSEVSLSLINKKDSTVIFSGTGSNASIEISGPVDTLTPS
jgi:hypothetical protein